MNSATLILETDHHFLGPSVHILLRVEEATVKFTPHGAGENGIFPMDQYTIGFPDPDTARLGTPE